jgi:hypothetical protein
LTDFDFERDARLGLRRSFSIAATAALYSPLCLDVLLVVLFGGAGGSFGFAALDGPGTFGLCLGVTVIGN